MQSLTAARFGMWFLAEALGLVGPSVLSAGEPSWFREANSEGAELRLVQDLPLLVVQGTPEAIGRQSAALTGKAIRQLVDVPWQLLSLLGRRDQWQQHVATSRLLWARAPADHRRELEACSQAAGVDRDKLIVLNTVLDIYGGLGCSSLILEARRSATGSPLFGRNLDIFAAPVLQPYNLVAVYRPERKHAFVAVGFPGVLGVTSGMNDRGLALAVHGVFAARGGAPPFDPQGVPCTVLYRRVLEECATVREAEDLLRRERPTTALSVVLCDRQRGAVVEVAPGGVAARGSVDGVCVCTNHFRAGRNLAVDVCPRFATLARSRTEDRLGLDDMARKLHAVNQGEQTLHTMVFEPGPLQLHVAMGSCPSSALPLKRLDLPPLLGIRTPQAFDGKGNGGQLPDSRVPTEP
jgi:isopenicillin-N N-acyltransferase-like protein